MKKNIISNFSFHFAKYFSQDEKTDSEKQFQKIIKPNLHQQQ